MPTTLCPRRLMATLLPRRPRHFMPLLLGLLILLLPAQASCHGGRNEEARNLVESFIKAWQRQDTRLMQELYPASEQMDFFYTSDEAHVTTVVRSSTARHIKVTVVSTFFGEHHDEVQRHITFLVDDNTPGACHICDSYGLACWERYPYYRFACRTGCIPTPTLLSDVASAERMRIARQMLVAYSQALYEQLDREIHIAESTPTFNDGNRTEGVALVQNESQFSLPGLRYTIIFYNDNRKELGRSGGWITRDPFAPGDVCAFNYAADILPGATLMTLVPDFEVEMIVNYVMATDEYDGTEYDDFRRRSEAEVEAKMQIPAPREEAEAEI